MAYCNTVVRNINIGIKIKPTPRLMEFLDCLLILLGTHHFPVFIFGLKVMSAEIQIEYTLSQCFLFCFNSSLHCFQKRGEHWQNYQRLHITRTQQTPEVRALYIEMLLFYSIFILLSIFLGESI